MNSNFDKEIDFLLREHARARAASAPAEQSLAHLDADELSAYAENALPAAMRARYAAHLADCDECRKIATAIALASNVTYEPEERAASQQVSRASSWLARLSTIFSPRIIGFAAPALALLIVGIIVFMATRPTSHNRTLVASSQGPQEARSIISENENAISTAPQTTMDSTATESANANASMTDTRAQALKRSPSAAQQARGASEEAPNPPAAATSSSAPVATEKKPAIAGNAPTDTTRRENPSTEAENRGQALRDEQKTSESTEMVRIEASPQQDREKAEARNEAKDAAKETTRSNTELAASAPAPAPKSAGQPSAPSSAARARRKAVVATDAAQPSFAAGAREASVSGRRFRQENGAWVDTAYRSSMETVKVKRGSDQYRALVADEPGLRNIAEQLSGEIVVVWNGRAYRIH